MQRRLGFQNDLSNLRRLCDAQQVVLPDTGHFQFLDEQSSLDRAVCATGRVPDATVRAFSQVNINVLPLLPRGKVISSRCYLSS